MSLSDLPQRSRYSCKCSPKDQAYQAGEQIAHGIVLSSPPVAQHEPPEVDSVLAVQRLGIGGVKTDGLCSLSWLREFINHVLVVPGIAHSHFSLWLFRNAFPALHRISRANMLEFCKFAFHFLDEGNVCRHYTHLGNAESKFGRFSRLSTED